MEQELSIEFLTKDKIIITQDCTLEDLASQLQKYSNKTLYTVNKTFLRFFDSEIPKDLKDIRFEYKQGQKDLKEYYFRNINDNSLYCIFGTDNAKKIYPRLEYGESSIRIRKVPSTKSSKSKSSKNNFIIIVDKGNKYYFPNLNYPVEVKIHNI